MHITALTETILVLIKFRIRGNLRFLSHAEMVKVFQRACVRGGVKFRYSRGFNPRPRLSLPLPRPVAVESDDDLLCLRVSCSPDEPRAAGREAEIKARLSEQLPEGCELLSARQVKMKASFQPRFATYVLPVRREYLDEQLRATVKRLLASESLNVQRRISAESSRFKNVDVRTFLKSIKLADIGIVVECEISSSGSIRVDEILELLGLDVEKLTGPIKRTDVQWREV